MSVGIGAVMLSVVTRLLFVTGSELEKICEVGTDGELRCPQTQFGVVVLSFVIFAAVGSWLLMRTQFGSWIMAVGGNKEAARSVGVPAARTKTTLFMLVSAAAWITGMLIAFRLTAVQADVGDGNEFRYIIVAVVGGNLLTGGYGSALGAGIGALIWGMISQGIGFANGTATGGSWFSSPSAGGCAGQQLRARPSREGAGQVQCHQTRPNRDHHHRSQGTF